MGVISGGAPLGAISRTRSETKSKVSQANLSLALLSTVSATVLSVSIASDARAQSIPAECTVDPSPLASGSTITCVSPTPINDGINTNVDDLTIIVGDDATPTTLNNPAGTGIEVRVNGGGVTVDSSNGTVIGSSGGLFLFDNGAGAVNVTTADVIANRGSAIFAQSTNGGIAVDTSAGMITATSTGINAFDFGVGAVNVESAGVLGGGLGIRTFANGGDTSITLTSGTLVRGSSGEGIFANSSSSGADITLQGMNADLFGGAEGLEIATFGADILVQNLNSVIGNLSDGINTRANGGDITITGANGIRGRGGHGIIADTDGGNISIQGVGLVGGIIGAGPSGDGIYANSSGGDINIGGVEAIGNVTGMRNGIFALSDGDITIDSSAGTVTGVSGGIDARVSGNGELSVTTANVNATSFDGVAAISYSTSNTGGVSVDTSAGTVSGGGRFGIFTRNNGSGDTVITAADVSSNGNDAIYANAGFSASGDIIIDSSAGSVMGISNGIDVDQNGSGAVSIVAADVTSDNNIAIDVQSNGGGISVDSSAGTVSASFDGIRAIDTGTGAVNITTADITTSGFTAINAQSRGGGVAIDTSAGAILGEIFAIDNVTGAVNVTSGDVTSRSRGINASNNGGDITIDSSAGTVSGLYGGISALTSAMGAISVTTADVSGGYLVGISVASNGGDIDITSTGTISAFSGAINSINYSRSNGAHVIDVADVTATNGTAITVTNGNGEHSVTATGDISGTNGILTRSIRGSIDVNVNNVTGTNGRAISVGSLNDDIEVDIVVNGDVRGTTDGIYAASSLSDLMIDTSLGTVYGESNGIVALNNYSGSINIITADVEASNCAAYSRYTGNAIRAVNNGDNLTIDTTAGTITADSIGINATNNESGDLSITTADVEVNNGQVADGGGYYGGYRGRGYYTGGDAIRAVNNGDNLTIDTTAGTITADSIGINATNNGSGDLSISVNDVTGSTSGIISRSSSGNTIITLDSDALVTGQDGEGINASSVGVMANITVQGMSGAIVGGTDGLDIDTMGADILVQNLDSVTGNNGNGIDAVSNGGDITITDVGTILGNGSALSNNNDSGFIIQGNSVSVGTNNNGVILTSSLNGFVLSVEGNGIHANSNDGDVSIQGSGLVGGITGTNGDGIFVSSGAGAVNIGGISAIGNVTGSDDGIDIINGFAAVGDIIVNSSAGVVSGGSNGIDISNNGTGAISVTTATVTGGDNVGINIDNRGSDIVIDSTAGTASALYSGIVVDNNGTGSVTINTADTMGTYGAGVYVANAYYGTDVTIDTTAGSANGGLAGIGVRSYGSGAITITSADASANNMSAGRGSYVSGIGVLNAFGTDINIDSSAGSVSSGSGYGILAINTGTGDTNITASDVTGGLDGIRTINSSIGDINITINEMAEIRGGDIGINAFASGDAADINIDGLSGSTVTGGLNAIDTRSDSAAINITNIDTINSSGGSGILAISNSGDISIQGNGLIGGITGDGTGSFNIGRQQFSNGFGILATTSGDINIGGIASNGDIAGNYGNGIGAYSGSGSIIIDTQEGSVSGNSAIFAQALNGAISVTTADVTGNDGSGIIAQAGGNVTVDSSAGSVDAVFTGISANSINFGDVTVRVADVTTDRFNAINVSANDGAIDITSLGTISAGNNGIVATARNGDVTIDSSGSISATDGNGIAVNADNGGIDIVAADVSGGLNAILATMGSQSLADLMIDTRLGSVSGGVNGIVAVNDGAGSITITAADVEVNCSAVDYGPSGNAIYAVAGQGGITIDTLAGNVAGDTNGIVAISSGAGAINITSSDVTSSNGTAISASTNGGGITVDTSAGTVTGDLNGIVVIENGTGDNSITMGEATETSNSAISNSTNDGGIAVDNSNGSAIDGLINIAASENSTGDNSITMADITGTTKTAIYASTAESYVTSVTSDGNLINDDNSDVSTGAINVTSADVTSTNGTGISASANGGGITIDTSAGTVTGAVNGIVATDNGTGDITITTGNVTGISNTAIYASAASGTVTLNIGGDVTGGQNGIVTVTQNGTDFTVAEGQTISGGVIGIATMAYDASATSNDTLNILGTVNGAIMTFEGDDRVILADGSTVNGAIMLGDGSDTVVLNGGTVGALRGGDGIDTIDFNLENTVINNSGDTSADGIAEFEIYNFNSDGAALIGTNTGLTSTNFNATNAILMGTLGSSNVTVASGGSLQVADGTSIIGNFVNNGSLGINAGATGTLNIDGGFAQGADGDVTFNIVSASDNDLINVSGDISLSGALNLIQGDMFAQEIRLIDGDAGLSGNFTTVNGLLSGLLLGQEIVTDTVNADVNLVTTIVDAASIDGLSTNQSSIANALTSDFANNNQTGGLSDLTIGLGLLQDSSVLSAALDEITPEIVNSNIEVTRSNQNRFRQQLLNQYIAPQYQNDGAATASLFATPAPSEAEKGPIIWGNIGYSAQRNDTTANNIGYRADGINLAVGISNIDAGGWQFGFGAGYSDFDTDDLTGVRDTISSELFFLGAHVSKGFNSKGLGLSGHIDLAVDYGTGDNDISINSAGGLFGFGGVQTGNANTDIFGASLRFTLDGSDTKKFPVQPFVSISYDSFSQDAVSLTGSTVTDISIDALDLDRVSFGYGIRADQKLGATSLKLGFTGFYHTGDTQSNLTTRFLSAAPNGATFLSSGFDIETQYIADIGVEHEFGKGWRVSLDGYAEFGDLEGYGGLFTLGKRF